MCWIELSAIFGGFMVGMMAGASRESTGGNVAVAITALQLGIFGFLGKTDISYPVDAEMIGKLMLMFLGFLFVFYIVGNVLRKIGWLKWMGISNG
ncbi:MAG: hypothetical protein WCU00_03080 [Candidatus Latescibacterota bacterium]